MAPQKDIPNLLHAIPGVLAAVPEAHFILVGEGDLRAELETLAGELGIRPQVHFLGFRSDVVELLKTIDVFALSSQWEGLPVTILEAMAMGKPVVCTDVGGVSEVVVPDQTGLLVPPRSPETLARAIIHLLTNPVVARNIGRCGRERVETHFSVQVMVKKIEGLYLDNVNFGKISAV